MSKNENFNESKSCSFDVATEKFHVKSTVMTIVNIKTENIEDNPDNGEDIEYTADLELSIEENGFTDPLEVTDLGMEDGKFMIVSGHRRRSAGVKLGMDMFPCIVRHFDSKEDMINCMLLSQSFRDSSKDPLLYARRYKLHEKYLEDCGFTGSFRKEIARRLGMSVQQADRYGNMGKVIEPVWRFVEEGKTSVTAVQPLASRTPEDQEKILLFMGRLYCNEPLTVSAVHSAIKAADAREAENKANEDELRRLAKKIGIDGAVAEDIIHAALGKEKSSGKPRREGNHRLGEFSYSEEEERGFGGFSDPEEEECGFGGFFDPEEEEEDYDDFSDEDEDFLDMSPDEVLDYPGRSGGDEERVRAGIALSGTFINDESSERREREKRIRKGDEAFRELDRIKKFLDDEDNDFIVEGDDVKKMFDAFVGLAEEMIVQANNVTVYHEAELKEEWTTAKRNLKAVIDGCS